MKQRIALALLNGNELDPSQGTGKSVPRWIAVLLAIFWFTGISMMTADDGPYFPLAKQIALTASFVTIAILLFSTGDAPKRQKVGCGIIFVFFGGLTLAAMWLVMRERKPTPPGGF